MLLLVILKSIHLVEQSHVLVCSCSVLKIFDSVEKCSGLASFSTQTNQFSWAGQWFEMTML